jgi:DNA polymerase epsilon subunit 4
MFLEGTFLSELTVSFSFIASRAEIIAFQRTEPPQKRKPKALQNAESQSEPTMLDKFVTRGEESQGLDVTPPPDVIMDEDGTMYAG